MNKKKQIEEIKIELQQMTTECVDTSCSDCKYFHNGCKAQLQAEKLYDLGYRKERQSEIFKNTWEIKCLINYAREYIGDSDAETKQTIEEIAQAIELTCQDIGFVMPIEMFLDWAIDGFITDYDGIGYWLDKDGNRICRFNFYDDSLPEEAMFVAWYNK